MKRSITLEAYGSQRGMYHALLTSYFKGELRMTNEEKGIILAALANYVIAIQDDLTQNEHTSEEVQKAFRAWNLSEELIKKYRK